MASLVESNSLSTGDKVVDDFDVNVNDEGGDAERSPRSGDNQRPRGRGRGRGSGGGSGRGRTYGGGWRGSRGSGRGGYGDTRPRNSESRGDKGRDVRGERGERNQNESRANDEQLPNGNDANGTVNGDKPRYNRRYRSGRDNRSGGGWRRDRRTPRNSESNPDGSKAETSHGEGAKSRPRRPGFTRFTHFLSVPFNAKPIQDKFAEFKAEVLEKYGSDEAAFIGEDLFQNPARIHLTFGIMQLDNEEQEKTAIELLEKCIVDIVRPALADSPLNVKIAGVGNLINKRSGKARVVFAQVTEGVEKLQEIANKITQTFVDEKIVIYDNFENQESSEVKVLLHITLMNTTFRERLHRRKPNYFKLPRPKQFFDAQKLLEDYNEFVFADKLNIDAIHISNARRFTTDGFYEPLAIVPIAEGAETVVTPRPPPKEKPQKEQQATPEKSGGDSASSSNNVSPQAAATTPVSN